MTTDIEHRPAPEFRDFLEGEVLHTYRRAGRWRRLRALAIVFAALAVGLTAGLAPAQIREDAQRDSLLQAAQSELSLAGLRLELARAHLKNIADKVTAGVLPPPAIASAQSQLRRMEAHAMRAKLDVDEIRATAMPPRDDLNAPLVGDKDFVLDRIRLDLFEAQQRMAAAEETLADAARRARVGAASDLALLEAELEVTRARAQMGVHAEAQRLRREFLEKGTPGEELSRKLLRQQVMMDAMVGDQEMKAARKRLESLRRHRASGAASELDVLRAEVELREREAELALLARQLSAIPRSP